jgi:hypothetical protein
VIGAILLTGFNLKVDVSLDQLQEPSSDSYQSFKKNIDIFGTDESLMLLVSSPNLLTSASLKKLSTLQQDIGRQIPFISNINSIINIPIIQDNNENIIISTAFDPWPSNATELKARLALINSNAPGAEAIRALISKDSRSTLIIISLQKMETVNITTKVKNYRVASDALALLITKYQEPEFNIQVTGQASLLAKVHKVLLKDIYILPAAALAISILTLLILFKRLSAVILPALVIIMPITSTLALMSLTSSAIQIPTGMLPPLLVVVSVAFCVHILTAFDYFLSENTPHNSSENNLNTKQKVDPKRLALIKTFNSKSKSLTMSMLSTAIALLTFGLSDIIPIANIGLFGAFGVFVACISIGIVIPVYLRFVPIAAPKERLRSSAGILQKSITFLMESCCYLALRFPKQISVFAIILMLLACSFASKIEFSHKPSEWLPHSWPVYQVSQEINQQFNSMLSIEILIDTRKERGIYEPDFINYLGTLHHEIKQIPNEILAAGMSFSLYSYLQQLRDMTQQADSQTNPSSGDISSRELSSYFSMLRLVGPKLLEKVSDASGQYTRIIIRVPTMDGKDYVEGIRKIESIIQAQGNTSYKAEVTGQASLIAATYLALSNSATLSYGLSLIVILIMMMLHMKSMRDGWVMMIPNLLPILVILAVMQLTNIPLDFLNILIVTLSMGLVVDDTIHFSGHFKEHFYQTHDATESVKRAIQETGRAMIITTLVLTLAWQMLLLSEFEQLGLFGLLTSAIMFLGLVADLIVAPSLMICLYGNKNVQSVKK